MLTVIREPDVMVQGSTAGEEPSARIEVPSAPYRA